MEEIFFFVRKKDIFINHFGAFNSISQFRFISTLKFKENNVMRHLRVLNLVCSHCNMRFFLPKRFILTHKRLGLFVRVWRAYGERMVGV